MRIDMTRLLTGCAVCGLLMTLAGCSQQVGGDYKSYGDLNKSTPVLAANAGLAPESPVSPETEVQATSKTPAKVSDPPFVDRTADNTETALTPEQQELPQTAPTQTGQNADLTTSPSPETVLPNTPRKVSVLVPEREFKVEGPEGALRISYDDFDLLKILNMDPVTPDAPELMPDWLQGLHEQRVRVRGFMYPTFQETGLTAFVLARDNQICCFGRDPKIYDLVRIRLRDGVTTNYIQGRPFDVVGVFRIQPDVDDGELYGLYRIEDAVVIER